MHELETYAHDRENDADAQPHSPSYPTGITQHNDEEDPGDREEQKSD
jgi:hypothetical protein